MVHGFKRIVDGIFRTYRRNDYAMPGAAMVFSYAGSFVAYIIMFYVMAHFLQYANANTTGGAVQTAFWLWLGFAATSMFVINAYSLKPIGLFFIDAAYWLIGMLIGGIILVKMKKK
jgi:Sec-independent protein secretion pathway component TatC